MLIEIILLSLIAQSLLVYVRLQISRILLRCIFRIFQIKIVESKSLKLYLFSFRNHGDFHEDCVNIIMNDLITLLDPRYIEVWGKFTPRGVSRLILGVTMGSQERNTKKSPIIV